MKRLVLILLLLPAWAWAVTVGVTGSCASTNNTQCDITSFDPAADTDIIIVGCSQWQGGDPTTTDIDVDWSQGSVDFRTDGAVGGNNNANYDNVICGWAPISNTTSGTVDITLTTASGDGFACVAAAISDTDDTDYVEEFSVIEENTANVSVPNVASGSLAIGIIADNASVTDSDTPIASQGDESVFVSMQYDTGTGTVEVDWTGTSAFNTTCGFEILDGGGAAGSVPAAFLNQSGM